jgi:hypothetical protein
MCTLYFRFAARVSEFMKVLEDISKGSYERTMVREKSKKDDNGDEAAVREYLHYHLLFLLY